MPPKLQVAVDQAFMLVIVDPGNLQARATHRHLQRRCRIHRQRRRYNLEAHPPVVQVVMPRIQLGDRLIQIELKNPRKILWVQIVLHIQHQSPVNPP
ncbi:hypothetical protein D3C75_635080 [compost metagenome]